MSSGPSKRELVVQAVDGDRGALEELLLDYHDALARYVARRFPAALRAVADVEDILHKTYVKVFRGIATCQARSERAFHAWLRTIARNQLADDLKHRRHDRRGGPSHRSRDRPDSWVLDLTQQVMDGGSTPSKRASRAEAVRAVQVALAALPEDYRRAIRLRYFQGLSLEETAAAMGRSPDSVRGLCSRAKQKLREMLGRGSSYLSG